MNALEQFGGGHGDVQDMHNSTIWPTMHSMGHLFQLLIMLGDVWHVLVKNIPKSGVCYGYKVCGEGGWDSGNRWETSIVLLDPYAPNVWGRKKFGVRDDHEAFTPGVIGETGLL